MELRRAFAALILVSGCAASATSAVAAGDGKHGAVIAKRWCASCHVVASDQTAATADAPSFSDIAQRRTDKKQLANFLVDPASADAGHASVAQGDRRHRRPISAASIRARSPPPSPTARIRNCPRRAKGSASAGPGAASALERRAMAYVVKEAFKTLQGEGVTPAAPPSSAVSPAAISGAGVRRIAPRRCADSATRILSALPARAAANSPTPRRSPPISPRSGAPAARPVSPC